MHRKRCRCLFLFWTMGCTRSGCTNWCGDYKGKGKRPTSVRYALVCCAYEVTRTLLPTSQLTTAGAYRVY